VTTQELAKLIAQVWLCPQSRAEALAPHVLCAMAFADVTTPLRIAHWLGQTGHESGRGRYTAELWGPTPSQVRYEPTTTLSARLGNTQPGDGRRYMGRGGIQVTGRFNYRALYQRLRGALKGKANVPDFEEAPRMLQAADWAWLSAADYWRSRGLNRMADADDIYTLTKRINGGTNGIGDRQALTSRAKFLLGV
jgi:putative chitinase